MICLDTRGLCFLCYKPCEDLQSSTNFRSQDGDDSFDSGRASDNDYDESDTNRESPTCLSDRGSEIKNIDNDIAKQTNLFCKILFRILGFDPLDQYATSEKKQRIDKPDKQFQICTDCLRIASSVCEICHQISSLQLLLNWKLMRIRDTMRSADKAPSRSSAFKNVFKCTEKSSQSPKNSRGPQEEFQEIQSLRKDIIRKCSEKLQNARPKVFLHRLTTVAHERHQKENENPVPTVSENRELSPHKEQTDSLVQDSSCQRIAVDTLIKSKSEPAYYQRETLICPTSLSNEKAVSIHLNENVTTNQDVEQACCNELDMVDAAVVDTSLQLPPEQSENEVLFPDRIVMDMPVETKTNAIPAKPNESVVEDQSTAPEEEDEPPPVPIEINTKLVQIKEPDNDEDFHPSDVEADDMSSDDYSKLDLNFQTEKNEGRKRKRKAKVKCAISDVKQGRPKFSTEPNVKKKPKTKLA
ncbi:hypothetical protein Ocin01_14410 [Orchesella cincta]|uniref:Uncharacterized protein n=1 Tax=Orchesella cincta TaxID=48709 RepID=A0A1D2MGY6_ORCCI|nr:hypothetical protein Ocin01_14410 [Orchesella cincta]